MVKPPSAEYFEYLRKDFTHKHISGHLVISEKELLRYGALCMKEGYDKALDNHRILHGEAAKKFFEETGLNPDDAI